MTVKTRTQQIAVGLYTLPFLTIVAVSLFFTWAGDLEMIIAGVALLPAILHFLGFRWCRFIVGAISAVFALAGLLRAIPALSMDNGKYFWPIWSAIWFIFVFAAVVSFVPSRGVETPGKNIRN